MTRMARTNSENFQTYYVETTRYGNGTQSNLIAEAKGWHILSLALGELVDINGRKIGWNVAPFATEADAIAALADYEEARTARIEAKAAKAAAEVAPVAADADAPASTPAAPLATEKQVSYALCLLNDGPSFLVGMTAEGLRKLPRTEISRLIDNLIIETR